MNSLAYMQRRSDRFSYFGWLLSCLAALIIFTGCGKKAPPMAPQQRPLTAVEDLKGDHGQGVVNLTWSHLPENWGTVEYVILRAQTDVSQPDCPGCPLIFQRTGNVRIPPALRKEKHALEFSQNLMTGFRYTFSVRPVHSSGAQGPDSNLVILELER